MKVSTSFKVFHLILFLEQRDFFFLFSIFPQSLFDLSNYLIPLLILLLQVLQLLPMILLSTFDNLNRSCHFLFSFFPQCFSSKIIQFFLVFFALLQLFVAFVCFFQIEMEFNLFLRFYHLIDVRVVLLGTGFDGFDGAGEVGLALFDFDFVLC